MPLWVSEFRGQIRILFPRNTFRNSKFFVFSEQISRKSLRLPWRGTSKSISEVRRQRRHETLWDAVMAFSHACIPVTCAPVSVGCHLANQKCRRHQGLLDPIYYGLIIRTQITKRVFFFLLCFVGVCLIPLPRRLGRADNLSSHIRLIDRSVTKWHFFFFRWLIVVLSVFERDSRRQTQGVSKNFDPFFGWVFFVEHLPDAEDRYYSNAKQWWCKIIKSSRNGKHMMVRLCHFKTARTCTFIRTGCVKTCKDCWLSFVSVNAPVSNCICFVN